MRILDGVGFMMPGRTAVVFCLVCFAPPVHGQDTPPRPEAPVTVSRAPLWGDAPRWRVAAEPSVVIGEAFGPVELHDVSDALRLPDGRIVVANDGSKELLAFSAAGEPLWAVGREGQGPKEFGRVMDLALRGDEILVWDTRNVRLARLSFDGEILGTTTFAHPEGSAASRYRLAGVLTDSTVLLHRYWFAIPAPGPAGAVFEGSPNLIYGMDGRIVESFGISGVEQYRDTGQLGPTLLWHRRTRHGVHGGRLYTGDGATWEVDVYGAGGELEGVVRLEREREPVSDAEREAFIERMIASLPEDFPAHARQEGIARLRASKVPDRKPAYGDIVVDRLGHVWLQEYRHLREYALPGPRRWTVLDPSGRWLGDLVLPDIEVRDIGPDWVLGWRLDPVGVEQVVLHRLDRGG